MVGSFYDTLNHLPDHEALAATFRTVAAVLRPGGLFVFDLNSAFGFERWWQYRIAFDLEGHHVDTQLAYDARTRTGRAEMGLAGGDGQERRFVLQQRCFSESEVEGALFAAGFTPEVSAPWSPIAKDSPSKTWFVATKSTDRQAGSSSNASIGSNRHRFLKYLFEQLTAEVLRRRFWTSDFTSEVFTVPASPASRTTSATPDTTTPAAAKPVTKLQTGAEALIRCLEREGGRIRLRPVGRRRDADLRRARRLEDQADLGAPRAGGHAHGRRLRARDRQAGRRAGDLRPGATNTVTGMLTALMDSVPMIVLTGQTISPMLGKDAFQEADVTGITYPVVKHSYLVKNPNDIPRITREAFFLAGSGRPGPVLIDSAEGHHQRGLQRAVRRHRGPPRLLGAGAPRQGSAEESRRADRQEQEAGALRRARRGHRGRRGRPS